MKRMAFVAAIAAATLSGCASMNGLSDSTSKFGCKAPDGVSCTSVSGVYANAQQGNLPALQAYHKAPVASVYTDASKSALPIALPGVPIRSQPKVQRIWVAPWVDDEGTLHDQSYLYVVLDPGKWQVEHGREATVQRALTRLRPLGQPNTASAAPSPPEGTTEPTPTASAPQTAGVPADKEDGK